jgi:hypothetical protein
LIEISRGDAEGAERMRHIMKRFFIIILGITVMALACSDNFNEKYQKELIEVRASGKTFSFAVDSTIISFIESGTPGELTAHLTAPPVSEVILDLTKADVKCTTPDVTESLMFKKDGKDIERIVFTPNNYDQNQTVEISVAGDEIVNATRGHRIILPALESTDSLYNGVTPPIIFVTVFEDDTLPLAYPVSPFIGETSVEEYNEIIVAFNRPMNESSINADSFWVYDSAGEKITAYVKYNSMNNTVRLIPHDYLLYGPLYTAHMNSGVNDAHGNKLYSGLGLTP